MLLIYQMVVRAFGDAFPFPMNYPGAMLLLAVTLVGSTLPIARRQEAALQFASIIALTAQFSASIRSPPPPPQLPFWLITSSCSCILLGIPLLIHQGFSVGKLWNLARAEAKAEDVGTHVPAKSVPTPAEHHAKSDKDLQK